MIEIKMVSGYDFFTDCKAKDHSVCCILSECHSNDKFMKPAILQESRESVIGVHISNKIGDAPFVVGLLRHVIIFICIFIYLYIYLYFDIFVYFYCIIQEGRMVMVE